MNPWAMPVPPGLAERARLLATGGLSPVEARPAATVVLLRDTHLGLQVYLIRRRTTMAFAAGMYAFPGGRVDPADTPREQAYELAAIRELFEETSVLLAGPDPSSLVPDTTGDSYDADRHELVGRAQSFSAFLHRRDLVARTDLLIPYAHWITPSAEERRFDTRFYLAELPSGQVTRDVSGEADRVAWLRPAEVEAACQAGEMTMLPPTAAAIAALAPFDSGSEAIAAVRSWEIPTVRPEVGFDEYGEARWEVNEPR